MASHQNLGFTRKHHHFIRICRNGVAFSPYVSSTILRRDDTIELINFTYKIFSLHKLTIMKPLMYMYKGVDILTMMFIFKSIMIEDNNNNNYNVNSSSRIF